MHKKLENLIEGLKAVKMSSAEKTDIYNRACLAIEKMEAARVSMHAKNYESKYFKPVKSNILNIWNVYIMERKFMPTLAFVFVLLITGGTSIAAEKSLPGDSLYPLKININEQIKALTATTPEAKAKFAADSTNERLKEAAILSSRGQLSDDNNQIIQKQILKNAGELKNQVASLVSTNKLKSAQTVTVNFESTLKAHALILEKLSSDQASASSTLATSTIGSLLGAVKDELATTTASRIDFDAAEFRADSNNKEKVEADFKIVQSDLADIKTLLEKSSIGTSTALIAEANFREASEVIEQAKKSIGLVVYPEALSLLQKAEQIISDIQALINADSNIVDTSSGPKDGATGTTGGDVLGTSTVATSTEASSASSTATTTVAAI